MLLEMILHDLIWCDIITNIYSKLLLNDKPIKSYNEGKIPLQLVFSNQYGFMA